MLMFSCIDTCIFNTHFSVFWYPPVFCPYLILIKIPICKSGRCGLQIMLFLKLISRNFRTVLSASHLLHTCLVPASYLPHLFLLCLGVEKMRRWSSAEEKQNKTGVGNIRLNLLSVFLLISTK